MALKSLDEESGSNERVLGLEKADLGSDGLDERRDAENVDHTGQIVGEHRERRFGADVLQPLHQEMGRTQAHLDRAEGVLDRLAALSHRLRVFIETPLHVLHEMFMLPPCDTRCVLDVQRSFKAHYLQASVAYRRRFGPSLCLLWETNDNVWPAGQISG